jgi:hypothetical protein
MNRRHFDSLHRTAKKPQRDAIAGGCMRRELAQRCPGS